MPPNDGVRLDPWGQAGVLKYRPAKNSEKEVILKTKSREVQKGLELHAPDQPFRPFYLLTAGTGWGHDPALALTTPALAQAKAQDPLPSWNEGPAKQANVGFVQKVTDKCGPAYVPLTCPQ
jgi:hypothetical protein